MEFINLISSPDLVALSLTLPDFIKWLRTQGTTKKDLHAARQAFFECGLHQQVALIDLVLYENN